MPTDYRKILKEYMDYVADCEGTDFVPAPEAGQIGDLSADEMGSLREIKAELVAKWQIEIERRRKEGEAQRKRDLKEAEEHRIRSRGRGSR